MTINVCIRGGGDLGSGVAYRLYKAGLQVIICDLAMPLVVRRSVAFAEAIFSGVVEVEGVRAVRCEHRSEIETVLTRGEIPVIADPELAILDWYQPDCVVDARLLKKPLAPILTDSPILIGLGPGFFAGDNCHAVVETKRGHCLGRVYWRGSGEPNSGIPETVNGHDVDRVLRAPANGEFFARVKIGDKVARGEVLAEVGGQVMTAPFDGIVRGLIGNKVPVTQNLKVGDIDPRLDSRYIDKISDKSLAVGGGVLEAILTSPRLRQKYCR